MYKVTRHESGLTIASAEMPHMASISLGVWVGVGGRFEPASVGGVSHFIEHMLFKGTRRRNAKEISEDVEGVGGYLNAFTTEESTCFYSKACNDRFEDLWDVLSDMFLNSTFDRGEIEKERNVIREELAMYLDQPHHHVQELLNETLWPDQPLGRPLTGTPETLAALDRDTMVSFMRKNYVASNSLVAVAGNCSHKQVVKAVSSLAGRFSKARKPGYLPAIGEQKEPRLRLFTKKTEQTQIALGIRVCSRHDERRFALKLLSVILGENMSSRLFQVVREDRGLAYSIASSLVYFDDVGTLVIAAGVETEKLHEALKLIIAELAKCTSALAGAGELRRARDYVIGQMDLSLENTENQMMWIGEQLLGYGRIIPPATIKDELLKVTPAMMRSVARDFFRPDHISLALVSPLTRPKGLDAILKS